ncbi:arsenite S-adenosylmethyltransferase [Candidatus Uabimicrobium amorphum]|uniref:Arsenite methyltransferase n=1 Tax=Uabimicrobium amorphum TaxID=2596890 RepID=A0A5S9ISK3_UABAM|nr:methyltransferase domain-containing protein [Candidatus Uabimicrobium amorphum]BBM86370.1 arsenite S-adenosylmethyltransferase [Candidatus Uabimicrobium amorphum]
MTENIEEIRNAIRKKYTEVSHSVKGKFKYRTAKEGAMALGYDLSTLGHVPDEIFVSFCGVGNPFSLGPLNEGEVILDVGCGAGFDLIFAHQFVGAAGQVHGIDLTPEMVNKARTNLEKMSVTNGQLCIGSSEKIPFADNTFDVVISNGVLNLSPLKSESFKEIYRVLKPSGRFQFADIVLDKDLPDKIANNLDAWSD